MAKTPKVKRSYIAHQINHTILLIDISSIFPPTIILPPEGETRELLSLRFQSWRFAEKFLLDGGARRESLDEAQDSLRKVGVAQVNTWV